MRGQFSRVEIAQRAQQHGLLLGARGGGPARSTRHGQGRLDGAQLPVVVARLGEGALGKAVEADEFAGEVARALEAFRHEHDLTDEGEVGQGHRDGAEEGLYERGGGVGGGRARRRKPNPLLPSPPLTLRLSGSSARPA